MTLGLHKYVFFIMTDEVFLCKSKLLKFTALYECNKRRILLVNYICSFFKKTHFNL